MTEPLPALPGGQFESFKRVLEEEHIRHLTAVSLHVYSPPLAVMNAYEPLHSGATPAAR